MSAPDAAPGCDDRLLIRNMEVSCVIGTRPAERRRKQKLVLNIEMECDLAPAGRSDALSDTVNYSRLSGRIAAMARAGSFLLIERFAQATAAICLEDPKVRSVTVTVDKPAALDCAGSAAVTIRRGGKK